MNILKSETELKKHQKEIIKFMVSRNEALCAGACGVGKSLISISVGFYLINKKEIDKYILIVTKSSMIEIKNDFDKLTQYGKPFVILDDVTFKEFIFDDEKVALIQYENLLKINLNLINMLSQSKIGAAFDECHRIKNPKSTLSKISKIWRKYFKYCYGFSATMVKSNINDLYNIVSFFNKDIFGNKKRFNDNFLNIKINKLRNGRQYPEIVSLKNIEELSRKTDQIMIKYFPQQNINFIQLTSEISDFSEYIHTAEGIFEDVEKPRASRLAALCKVVNKTSEKLELYLKTIKDNLKYGVITYCEYHDSKDLLIDALKSCGIECGEITGKQTTEERIKVKTWFTSDPQNKVLIISPAGGQSLNLHCTNKLIFYDIPFSVGAFTQTIGRIVRLFSKYDEFDIYFIIINDTIDEYKYQYIAMNKDMIMSIFKNDFIPESAHTSFNSHILKRLRSKLLWKK